MVDLRVLDRIWRDEYKCFIPTIKGWRMDPVTGTYKALEYTERKGFSKGRALDILVNTDPLDSQTDCYFCPIQFTGTRVELNVVPELNILWADLDEADPRTMNPKPTIAWKSSKTHYQALWLLDRYYSSEQIKNLNRDLSYHVGADKSGWDLTQLLRVPGSWNFKRSAEDPDRCILLWDDGPVWLASTIISIIRKTKPDEAEATTDIGDTISKLIEGWKLTSRTRMLLEATEAPLGERSDRLWELEKLLVESGMPVALIVEIIKLTVWNKFADRKDGDKQLLAETLKAEKEFRLTKAVEVVESVEEREEGLLTFDGFMEMDIPPPEYLVDGFLQYASVGICAGEPKTMKSTLMLDMALSVASGKPFLGVYKVRPCPVLYIQEENSEADIKRRFTRIAYNRRVLVSTSIGYEPMPIPLFIMNNKGINLQSVSDREFMDKTVEENGIKLLILDPWYMMCGDLNENDAGEVGKILKYLTTLRNRFECTVMLVHHFKKGDASRGGQRMRGSSVFHSWIENGLYSELNKGKEGNIIMEREFRAFPTTKGLNIVFSAEDSPLAYDVRVHDISDSYLERVKPTDIDEDDDSTDGVFELEPLPDDGTLTRKDVGRLVEAKVSRSKLTDTYGVSKRVIDTTKRSLKRKGRIM